MHCWGHPKDVQKGIEGVLQGKERGRFECALICFRFYLLGLSLMVISMLFLVHVAIMIQLPSCAMISSHCLRWGLLLCAYVTSGELPGNFRGTSWLASYDLYFWVLVLLGGSKCSVVVLQRLASVVKWYFRGLVLLAGSMTPTKEAG